MYYICIMDIILLKQNGVEWDAMWNFVANHPINEGLVEPRIAMNEGEAWQYMCTYTNKERNKFIHELRHKNHPNTNGVYFIKFNSENKISDEDIIKTIKVK